MRFYVSWYPDDPWYPHYDKDCAMLISVSSVSRSWTLSHFDNQPKYLLLDSGGYRYAIAPHERATPKEVFKRQLEIVKDHQMQTILCALDTPLLASDLLSNDKDQCIDQTIAYAYEFRCLFEKSHLPEHVQGLAVIQGYDVPSVVYCAQELKVLGFTHFGLGSLAPLKHRREILARVAAVMEIVGPNLHIFGVSAIKTLRALKDMGIDSVDSSRPAKAAIYNQVFYSRPFRRFGIADSTDRTGIAMPAHRRLSEPLPCGCPACGGRSNPNILKRGHRKYIALRTLHNYWHLKRVIV